MRTFEHFPTDKMCKICGTNDDTPCILVPIDDTDEGNICEAVPVHVDCLAEIRLNKEAEIFYIRVA